MSDQNKDNQDEFEAIFPDDAHRSDAQSDASIESEYTNDLDVVQSVEDVSDTPAYQDSVTDGLEQEPISGEDYLSNSDSTSAIEDDLHDFSDIDDGVDETGIFATPPDGRQKRKKSSSPALMAGVVLLAVGGAGGYFYYKNPEIVAQIQENFVNDSGMSGALSNLNDMLGGATDAGSGTTISPVDVVSSDMPPQPAPYSEDQNMSSGNEASGVVGSVPVTPENQPPLGDVVMDLPHPVSDGADMPPAPTPEGDAPVVIGAMPADGMMQPAQPPILDSMGNPIQNIPTGPNGEMLPNVMGGEIPEGIPAGIPNENMRNDMVMAMPQDAPPQPEAVNDMPVVEDAPQVQENADIPPAQEESAPVVAAVPPAVEPAPEAVAEVSPDVPDMAPPVVQDEEIVVVDKAPEAVVEPVVAPVAQAEKVDPNKGNAKIFKPTETVKHKVRLVDDVSQEKVPNQTELADAGASKKSEKDILHEELARDFFDAPPGKILDAMPAPTMDVKRGKTESIIVVHDTKSKGSVSKANASSKSGKASKAQQVQIETTSLDSRVIAADRALKLGRIDSAKTMFDELYELNPREPRVLMGRAIIFQKIGENARAISTYEELLAVSPNNAEAVINLAGLVRGDQPAVALGRLLDLRQKYPDNPTIVAQLAISYADSGNLDDALRYLDKAIAMQPNNPQHYYNRAILSERAGKVPHAISFYEKALEVDAIQGGVSGLPRDVIYDRLARLRVAQ